MKGVAGFTQLVKLLAPIAVAAAATLLLICSPVGAETVQLGGLRVSFSARFSPRALPRGHRAPVSVEFGGKISTADGSAPPQLTLIQIAISRNGRLDYTGLPTCNYHQIQPASTVEAIAACPDAVVGEGTFRAAVALPEQSPFPSRGVIVAFNGLIHGRHAIFAHIYGTTPLPQSSVIIFRIGRARGAYRTMLRAEIPQVAAEWGHVSSVRLALARTFTYRGRRHSFIAAGCPVPAGLEVGTSPFVQTSFGFTDGRNLAATLVRSCRVR